MPDFITVQPDISTSISHEIRGCGSIDEYLERQIARIDDTNRHLMQELCSFAVLASEKLDPADPAFKEKLRANIVAAGVAVYRMLESQHEANELNELWGE